jgi:4-hydroxybenzoate polyprenyltransferase
MAMNLGVLFSLPPQCVMIGGAVTPLVFLYPYAKRYFPFPQVVLGATFNSGIMIGYSAAVLGHAVNWQVCLPFYAGAIMWTTYYDTIYAF